MNKDREGLALAVAEAVDAAVGDRVLIPGTLTPTARDVDFVVRSHERDVLANRLKSMGFLPRGRRLTPRRIWTEKWVRFIGATAYPVDLNPAERWGLPAVELNALFAEATPIEGWSNLARPAPHHVLLLVTRSFVAGKGHLSDKQRRRIEGALANQGDAWDLARDRAELWSAGRAFALLEQAWHSERVAPFTARLAARFEVFRRARAPYWRVTFIRRRIAAAWPRRGLTVAFSGAERSGRRVHLRTLQDTLATLRVTHLIELKTAVGHGSGPLKTCEPRVESAPRHSSERAEAGLRLGVGDPVAPLRFTTAAFGNAFRRRAFVLQHIASGSLLMFDGYVLDDVAQLRWLYGDSRRFRVQRRLLLCISPRPTCAYLLHVGLDKALVASSPGRHTDQRRREDCYIEEAERLGARLPGSLELENLAEEIATEVWRSAH